MTGGQVAEGTINELELLKLMYLSREGDRREGVLLRQSKGWFQVAGMGHETLAVIALLMQDGDYLFPYYRDRAMALGRGVTNLELAHSYFAKRESSSGGRQMPGHYSSRSRNIWSVPTPTASNLLPACGAAWGMQLNGDPGVVVTTTGDAASRQGEFYEAVAFAVERQLPIVIVVEDNRYGISTNTDEQNPFKLGIFDEDLGVCNVDARRVENVADAATEALSKAREGGGPTVLVCELDRLCSHTSSDDHRVYRDADEIAEMMTRDPIEVLANRLISTGELQAEKWEQTKKEINEQVDTEYIAAEEARDPRPDELLDELLADPLTAERPPLEGGKKWRMVDAVNEVFKHGLETDPRYVFFGEDIEDPKGGVFGLTAGLSNAFPEKVFNSPLAEATIAGVACGLAGYGMRPVFEMQFVDFTNPAWNQIAQNLATIRWRTAGDWICPAVLYAPCGAYLPGGSIWHSQSNEAQFAHVPGLRVVLPSTPEDAAGLMWTAMRADDPTIFLVPKHLFRQQIPVGADVPAVPFGSARIRREGSDVTLVTWGNGIEVSLAAANEVAEIAAVEVIDLRSIQPWDRHTIQQSLAKSGRLIVVQEDAASCSVGQMLISELTGDTDSWYSFVSPPQLVSRPDVHIGFNPIYEYAAVPSIADVVQAVEQVMED